MTVTLRIILLAASILNCAWIIQRIRKAQTRIEDSVFWILFSGLLIGMSLFPQMIEWGAAITGVQSAVNFVFLSIIFVLMAKLFRVSIKMSQMEHKLQTFAQIYAIDKRKAEERDTDMENMKNKNRTDIPGRGVNI